MPDPSSVPDGADPSKLRLAPGAPAGALPGCPGDLVIDVDHSAGGWSSDCDVTVSIDCEAKGCWWSRMVDTRSVPVAVIEEARRLHDEAAAEEQAQAGGRP